MGRWETYDSWNQAVADVFFMEDLGGQPVYIDLDGDQVAQLSKKMDVPAEEVPDALASAVRNVLRFHDGRGLFAEPIDHLGQWLRTWRRTARTRRFELDPPPVLALLAVFSMAAERMGRDATMAANNYFGRLAQVLGITDPDQKLRLERHYRGHVEFFWHLLALWLTGLDGLRGLPSAVALSYRFIGLSVSQALVREHDRTKLPRFFATYGLSPGQEVTPREMEALLDEWMKKDPPPISRTLATLWRQPTARERIAGVVSLELQAWDGIISGEASSPALAGETRGDVRLVAMTRAGLFGSSVELNVVARISGCDGPRRMTVTSAAGDEKPVFDFIPGAAGWHRLHRPADLEKSSVLDGVLALTDEDGRTIQRRPRRVVPMSKDERLGMFLEVERLQLAEDGLVFAAQTVADEVEQVLEKVARPGFRRIDGDREGVPAQWTLFRDVQLLALLPEDPRSDKRHELNVLLPSVASQLTFADGLKLPGQMRKYSSLAPPEIRAVAAAAEHIRLQVIHKRIDNLDLVDDLTRAAVGQIVCEREANASVLVVPLADEDLEDGDYEALLFVDRAKVPVQRLPFWLRSGDSVDLALWRRSPRLVYQIADQGGWAALSADEWKDGLPPVVDGANADGDGTAVAPIAAPRSVWWTQKRPSGHAETNSVVLTTPDPTSCLVTGAHHWDLPYARSVTVPGVCRKCGLVRRFPNTKWAAEARKRAQSPDSRADAAYHVDIHDIEPVNPGSLTWDIGLDALMHAGGGAFSALERVALQVEGSSLFVDEFVRTLEALGHIEVKRDDYTLHPVEWEISPSTLAELSDGSFLLVGYWPASMIASLEETVRPLGGHLTIELSASGPRRRILHGLLLADIHALAASLGEVAIAEDAARSILRVTPNLSAVEESLPQVTMPGARRIQQFHVGSASWVAKAHAEAPGAYRLESFGTTDVIRRKDDVVHGTARVGTVHLVKHLEAMATGRPLLAYDAQSRCLHAPLGADLPGLYGRVAVLCSGRPPEKDTSRRLLLYHDVPADLADMLAARLAC